MVSAHSWIVFLSNSGTSVGFPLVVAGLGLMLFGWRCWKVCVVLAFVAIGGALGAYLVGPREDQWIYALACGTCLGLLSFWPVHFAICILGGLTGGGFGYVVLETLGLVGRPLWIAVGTVFLACTAYAFINRQRVVILTTSFLGAVLLLSGLTAFIMAMPGLYGTMRSLVEDSMFVQTFILFVPTVMSAFYQIAEVRRLNADV